MSHGPERPYPTRSCDSLSQKIGAFGPIGVDTFMELALTSSDHGYYRRHSPLGSEGDFVTAPEVSQIFGEMLAIWWGYHRFQLIGDQPFDLVELGPGRGTLAADCLAVFSQLDRGKPSCARVQCVEINPALREAQEAVLGSFDLEVLWHESIEHIQTDRPMFLIANEFFDALPVRQLVWSDGKWLERCVVADADAELRFQAGKPVTAGILENIDHSVLREGDILSLSPARERTAEGLGRLVAEARGGGLLFDYGYWEHQVGDTLLGVRDHRVVNPLGKPGDTDISAYVAFEPLAQSLKAQGLWVAELLAQRQFLFQMGIENRAEVLSRTHPEILSDARRLVDPMGMGSAFKVMGFALGSEELFPFTSF